ncbi:MAG: methyltransferase domain-containing protein [Promethearchaeota archaeon]
MFCISLQNSGLIFENLKWNVLLQWTDPRKALREIVRVTKPGGMIWGLAAVHIFFDQIETTIRISSSHFHFQAPLPTSFLRADVQKLAGIETYCRKPSNKLRFDPVAASSEET